MTDPMEFDPSVDDEEKYSKVIAPFFLNAVNIMTGSKIGVSDFSWLHTMWGKGYYSFLGRFLKGAPKIVTAFNRYTARKTTS